MPTIEDLPSLKELENEFNNITCNMSMKDASDIQKGVTPEGWSDTDAILMKARRVLDQIRFRNKCAEESE